MMAEVKPEWPTTFGLVTIILASFMGRGKRIWTLRACVSLVFTMIDLKS